MFGATPTGFTVRPTLAIVAMLSLPIGHRRTTFSLFHLSAVCTFRLFSR